MMFYFAIGSAYSLQQVGASAALGGVYALIYLMVLLAIVIALLLIIVGLWRYRKAKQGKPLKRLSFTKKLVVIGLSLYPIWIGIMAIEVWYSRFRVDKARVAETVRRYTVLTESTRFGELEIKAGSLINRGDPHRFTDLVHRDSLLDLKAVRFVEPTLIAGVQTYAMSVEGSSLTLELAEAHRLETVDFSGLCPEGYVLMLPFPNGWIEDELRLQPPYTWFIPSQWNSTACFESSTGVMVLDVNEHGIYFPGSGRPYGGK